MNQHLSYEGLSSIALASRKLLTKYADGVQILSDETVIQQIRAGNSDAFAQLYEKYKSSVYAYSFRLLQNESSAEDAVQNAFMKAYQSISTLDDPAAFKYWLFIIARNEVYSLIRKSRSNGQSRPTDESEDVWSDETPLTQAMQTNTTDIVQALLGQLKTEYREVLILREYDQLSYAEIAAVMGDTESSVKSRIFRARKELTKKLKPYF
jgi:RNA polymerase sigma-70 factor, ECF subfamily